MVGLLAHAAGRKKAGRRNGSHGANASSSVPGACPVDVVGPAPTMAGQEGDAISARVPGCLGVEQGMQQGVGPGARAMCFQLAHRLGDGCVVKRAAT